MNIKNRKKIIIAFFLIALLFSFTSIKDDERNCTNNERYVLSTLYSLIAGEYKALQFQAFNLAKNNIKEYILENGISGNEAIVLDIDETILETSLYQAKMIVENLKYPQGFDEFIKLSKCKAVPGSIEFLRYVDSCGINIFYVSNRTQDQMLATIKNMESLSFPRVNKNNYFLRAGTSSKEQRRNRIQKKYNILLYIGDNLADFSNIFETKTNEERNNIVDSLKSEFGKKFVILPNPSYGDWEALIYCNNWKLSPHEMNRLRILSLKTLYDF